MAFPVYKSAGAFSAGTGAVTPALPTGWLVDDIFLLFVESANEAIVAPTGWVEVTNSPQGTGTAGGTTATRLAVFWKRAEPSTVAPTVADTGNHTIAVIINVRGCVTTGNPWDITSGDVGASSTAVAIPTLTTTVADCLVVLAVSNATDSLTIQTSAFTNANLTNLTERADDNKNAGNGGGIGIATGEKATAGAIGSTSATLVTASVQGRMAIALKPVVPLTSILNVEQYTADHSTKIATGGSTTDGVSTNLYLDALVAGTVKEEKFTLKVENELIATAFDNVANKTQATSLWYDPENPHVRRGHTQVYDPTLKRMLAFGGWNGTTRYNDVWELILDPLASPRPQWRQLAPTGTPPTARNAHVAIFDATLNRMITGFGSTGSDTNDLYSLSFSGSRDGAWTTLSPTGTLPLIRSQASIVNDPTNKKAYLVAGWGAARMNDIQELDYSTTACVWTAKSADGAVGAMSKRNDPACVWDNTNSRIIMFGGFDGTLRLNDTWEYVPSTNVWTNKTAVFTGTAPSIRELAFHTLDTTNNRMVIFGGRNGTATGDIRNDMAYLTLTAGSEAWSVVAQTAGEGSYGAWTNAGCYDPNHKLAICFGGWDTSLEAQRNVLAIDCSSSTTLKMGQVILNQWFRGRDAMGYAYNSARDETLVVGGYARVDPTDTTFVNGDHTSDMWIFKHATNEWIPAIRGKAWIPFVNREGATAIYDTNRSRFIIFGGLSGNNTTNNTHFNDTWELKVDANGLYVLTKLNPTGTKPSARWLQASVYDATNNRMIVFGGDASGTYLNDVHALSFAGGADGAWSAITPSGTAPSARRQSAYAIDTGTNEMIISHGGLTVTTFAGDTFKLVLTAGSEAWSLVTGTGAPSTRRGMTAVYHAVNDAFYLFGGYNGTVHYNDLYKLTFGATPAWSTLAPTGVIPDQRRSHTVGYSPTSGKMMITHGRSENADTFDSRANTYEYNVAGNSWANARPKVYIEGSTLATGLVAGSYHWQSWVTGTLGGDSAKLSYGGNAETVADYVIGGGVTTLSITKSLKYTVKVTPTALTKSLKYALKTTPTAVAKSLKYTVRVPLSLTKSLKYTLARNLSLTKSLKYTVKTTPSALSKSLRYGIKITPSVTKSLKYTVILAVSLTKSLKYTLRITPASLSKSLKYCLKTTLSLTKSLKYVVRSSASITKSLKYTLKTTPSALSKSLKYTLKITPSAVTKSLAYRIKVIASLTKSLRYAVKTSPSLTKSLKYTLKGAQAVTKSLSYRVTIPASLTKALIYRVKVTASALTKSLTYRVKRTPSAVQKTLIYRVVAPASVTKTLKYTVIKVLALTKSLKYALKITPPSLSKSLTYRVSRTPSALQKTLIYRVAVFLSVTKSLKYTVIKALAITKSLKYTLKITPTALTKSVKYTVIKSLSATKSLRYVVRSTPTAISKTLVYKILKPISVTKSLKYSVRTNPSVTKSLKYVVSAGVTTVSITKSLKYTIVRALSVTKSLKYTLKTFASITKTAKYTVRITPSALTKSLKYTVRVPLSVTKSLKYVVKNNASLTKSLRYLIKTVLNITKSAKYTLKTTPSAKTKSLVYRVNVPASVTKSLRYAVNRTIGAITKSLKYTVITPQSVTKSSKYTVVRQLSVTKALVYKVVKLASLTKSLKYVVTRGVSLTKSLSYKVKANVAVTKSLKYTIAKIQAVTKSSRYTVRLTNSATKSLTYKVKALSALTKSLKYTVRTSSSLTKALKYTIKITPSALGKSLKYTIRITPSAVAKSLAYKVVVPIAPSKSLKYTVRVPVSTLTKTLTYRIKITPSAISKSLSYRLRTTLALTKSLAYKVRTPLSLTKSLKYVVKFTPSSITKSLKYAIRTSPSVTKSLSYKVRLNIALAKTVRYFIRTQGSQSKSLKYSVRLTQPVTKSLKYTLIRPLSVTKSLRYVVSGISIISVTKSLRYFVRTKGSPTKSLKYVVRITPTLTKAFRYFLKVTTSIQKSLSYDIRLTTAVQKSLAYRLKTTTAVSKSLRYVLKGSLTTQKSLVYRVKTTRSPLAKSLSYRLLTTPATILKQAKYAVRSTYTRTLALAYRLKLTTSNTKSLKYAVRIAPTAMSKSLKYLVTQSTDPYKKGTSKVTPINGYSRTASKVTATNLYDKNDKYSPI